MLRFSKTRDRSHISGDVIISPEMGCVYNGKPMTKYEAQYKQRKAIARHKSSIMRDEKRLLERLLNVNMEE